MTVSLKGNFLLNARGFTLLDGGGITWSINQNTNAITATAGSAGTATKANNLAAGIANQIPYQTGIGATSFFSAANYGVQIYGATGVPASIAGAAGVLQGSATAIPAFTTSPNLSGTNFTGIPNAALSNSAVTIIPGTGVSGGGAMSLGGSVTLSIGQAIGVTSSPTFAGITCANVAATQINAVSIQQAGQTAWLLYQPASSNSLNLFSNTNGVVLSVAGTAFSFAGAIGVNGASPPAQSTGWGTPTGTGAVSNFSGTAATTAQIQQAVATIIAYLKSKGDFAT